MLVDPLLVSSYLLASKLQAFILVYIMGFVACTFFDGLLKAFSGLISLPCSLASFLAFHLLVLALT